MVLWTQIGCIRALGEHSETNSQRSVPPRVYLFFACRRIKNCEISAKALCDSNLLPTFAAAIVGLHPKTKLYSIKEMFQNHCAMQLQT